MTGSFGYPGWGTQPHDDASIREHLKEVGEDVRHDREADDVAKAHPKRPWWKFWGKRTG
jgi:uncharacterized phage-associated protein